ncbi:hypothetical protein HF289_15485 [Acidithiobacillus ferrooxidans]|uniref:hypothetical protein n=1 Tax=Acidithiobacillus ferrooxidans TaxID=920 RepID=UPI001C07904A|nr:hypothetical protein [Acidithiobacillus ferrooxidans]MBU2858193.1 hypothetical protein [Acidithiobacillus ferrooxidans]MDA8180752.1 hypothetical protein [Acidithiobacillus sp.]
MARIDLNKDIRVTDMEAVLSALRSEAAAHGLCLELARDENNVWIIRPAPLEAQPTNKGALQ